MRIFNHKGLTLVESMIALGILAGLFLGGMTISNMLAKSSKETERELFLTSFIEELRFHIRSKISCQLNFYDSTNRTANLIPRDNSTTFKLNRVFKSNGEEFVQLSPTPSQFQNNTITLSDIYINEYNDNRKEARLHFVFQETNNPTKIFHRSFMYKIINPLANEFTCENQDEAFTNALLNEICDRICDQALSCPSDTVEKCQQAAQINLFRMKREICEQIGSWDAANEKCNPLFANKRCGVNQRIIGWDPDRQDFICKTLRGNPTGAPPPVSPSAGSSCNDPYHIAQVDIVELLSPQGVDSNVSRNARVFFTQLAFEQAYIRRSEAEFNNVMTDLNNYTSLQEFISENNCLNAVDEPASACERVYLKDQTFLLPILNGSTWINNGGMRSFTVSNAGSPGTTGEKICGDQIDCNLLMEINGAEPYDINNLEFCEE